MKELSFLMDKEIEDIYSRAVREVRTRMNLFREEDVLCRAASEAPNPVV